MQTNIRYKLTNELGQTHNQTQWGPGAIYATSGEGDLCGPGWLHCYSDPVLAILMNPRHVNFKSPRLCEVEVSGQYKLDYGLKEGWTTMTFKQWLPVPTVTAIQRIAFGILCAKQVYTVPSWLEWADNWLSGKDRTPDAADAATAATDYADAATAAAAAAAAYAAATDYADYAATAAAYAITATADYAAATAAYAAATDLDLVALAHQALEYK